MKMTFSAKCSDMFDCRLYDDEGKPVKEHDGYVPYGFNIGGGDYIQMTVDLKTGQIVGWKTPTDEHIQSFIEE